MPSRKTRRAQKMRRKQHQKATAVGTRRKFYNPQGQEISEALAAMMKEKDVTVIDVPRGPKPSPAFHREPGRDARAQTLHELARLGITEPDETLVQEYRRLRKACRGDVAMATAYLEQMMQQATAAAASGLKRAGKFVDKSRELKAGQELVVKDGDTSIEDKPSKSTVVKVHRDEVDLETGEVTDLTPPSEEEWEDILATAKKRKRAVKTFAEKAGYRLLDSDTPKARHIERESWVKA